MKKRTFLKNAAIFGAGVVLFPGCGEGGTNKVAMSDEVTSPVLPDRLRTAHIGVGNMGGEDLAAMSSHDKVDVVALCDVDANALAAAKELHPDAKTYSDYRIMLKEMEKDIDAVVVSTPDHTHAPASMLAMSLDKPVYCQKPLTHHVSEARAMRQLAADKGLITQM